MREFIVIRFVPGRGWYVERADGNIPLYKSEFFSTHSDVRAHAEHINRRNSVSIHDNYA